jgi:tetratricopeptide (TPR) repeat protein
LAFLLVGSLAFAAPAPTGSDAQFARANQEYAEGKFREAISDYEAIAQAGDLTAALFYDLGNAYFRTQDFGRAILNYERAQALEPNHPEAQANLRIARDEARALELVPGWPERFGQFVSLNQQTMAATILFWTGSFLLVTFIFLQRRRKSVLALSLCSLVAATLLIFAIIATENGSTGRSLAIVTNGETQARLATADTAATVLVLPAGSEVKVEQQRGDWAYAVLPNNLRGWIPAKNIELVRL